MTTTQHRPIPPPRSSLLLLLLSALFSPLIATTLLFITIVKISHQSLAPHTGDFLATISQHILLTLSLITATSSSSSSSSPPSSSSSFLWYVSSINALLLLPNIIIINSTTLIHNLSTFILSSTSTSTTDNISHVEVTIRCIVLTLTAFGPIITALSLLAGRWMVYIMTMTIMLLMNTGIGSITISGGCNWWLLYIALTSAFLALFFHMYNNNTSRNDASSTRKSNTSSSSSLLLLFTLPLLLLSIQAVKSCLHATQPCFAIHHHHHHHSPSSSPPPPSVPIYQCTHTKKYGTFLSVIKGSTSDGQYQYRLLRADHSILGGVYTDPPDVAGQSVYSAFYLQQGCLLLLGSGGGDDDDDDDITSSNNNNDSNNDDQKCRSLVVGLGIGTAVHGLRELGNCDVDVVELHEEVLHIAQHYFGLKGPLNGERWLAEDAILAVDTLLLLGDNDGTGDDDGTNTTPISSRHRYKYIIHDVFSGGSPHGSSPQLMSPAFFTKLKHLLLSTTTMNGVLAVNYYGSLHDDTFIQVWCSLCRLFSGVRVFGEDHPSHNDMNYVLFASDRNGFDAVDVSLAFNEMYRGDGTSDVVERDVMRMNVLKSMAEYEVVMTGLLLEEEEEEGNGKGVCEEGGEGGRERYGVRIRRWWRDTMKRGRSSISHWKVMRQQGFWR